MNDVDIRNHFKRQPESKGQRRKRPSWSNWSFEYKPPNPPKPKKCSWCGEIKIPLAHHKKKFFCSFVHGKQYLRGKKQKKSTKNISHTND